MARQSGAVVARSAAFLVLGVLMSVAGLATLATTASAASAKVWLTTTPGATVPENSTVKVGQALTIHVSGFAGEATVLYQFGPAPLPTTTTTDASGAGTAAFSVPKVAADAYVLTATSDQASATFVVTVAGPTTSTSSPAPQASNSSSSGRTTSSTTRPAKLAHTGGPATLGLSLAGAVVLAFGVALLRLGAPVFMGRHERIAGAHLR